MPDLYADPCPARPSDAPDRVFYQYTIRHRSGCHETENILKYAA